MSALTLKSVKKDRSGLKTRKRRFATNFLNSVKHNSVGIYNKPFFQVDIKFWIFIPVYNFGKFLESCFKSLEKQSFQHFRVLVIDDCSTDDCPKIIKAWSKRLGGLEVITNLEHKGLAYTKWQAITWTRMRAAKNDIFTILEGDNYFSTKAALEIIVNKYLTTKCWTTYGSAGSKRAFTLKHTDIMRGVERFDFQHPHTCLAFLLDYMVKEDFIGNWLTDRQFVSNLLELSGPGNICHIKQVLYKYRRQDDNAHNKVPNSYKRQPALAVEEKIHIVMCCYKRHENLKDIIIAIDKQSVAKRIVFHIVNTNPEVEKWRFLKRLIAEAELVKNIEIRICNTNKNLFGYARFLYTKSLLISEIIPYVIFIDDDQKLTQKWVENIYNTRAALAYNCWFGRIFDKFNDVSEMGYWKGVDSSSKPWSQAKYDSLKIFDYGGTGGSIIDTNIFRFDILFRCPDTYRNIEDLWLSFVVKQIVGGKINIFREKIVQNEFANENKTALWKTIGDRKSVFLRSLVNLGYLKGQGFLGRELEKFVEKKSDADKSISKFTFA